MDWNALKIFLAIAEAGSLSAASRKLHMSQPTLSRKLMQLEQDLDSQLFQRLPKGLVLTESGEKILNAVRAMEEMALDVEKAVTGQNKRLEGTVRLTTTEFIGTYWITEEMKLFRDNYPGICVDLNVSMQPIDLLRREADIAIRLGRPMQPDLIGKKLGQFENHMAASTAYLERYGAPRDSAALKEHQIVGFSDEMMTHPSVWTIFRACDPAKILFKCNSLLGSVEAVRNGLGLGLVSELSLQRYREIKPLHIPGVKPVFMEVWLVTHADIRHNARIRALYDFLGERIRARFQDLIDPFDALRGIQATTQ
tara:strand:+ start:5926 stop:6855 length:930 start_codon:yes stop_codon:yes gene_type:complete